MQINNTPQISYQPNFKQVNLVKVPKYFFKEGSSSLVCEKFVQESHNSFGVEFDYATCDGSYEIALPVYWRYDL